LIDELFLYDQDNGLFKAILNKSAIIQGRYHVSPNYGHSLNTANLESFFKDPKSGLTDAGQKYPICVCLTPGSRFTRINDQKWEEFYFNIFFLTRLNHTGTNEIKKLDRDTNTSGQHIWYDWSDMKQCAADFIEILRQVILKRYSGDTRLKTVLNIDYERAPITRISKFNNDTLNGVALNITAFLFTDACTLKDYEAAVVDSIDVPSLTFDH